MEDPSIPVATFDPLAPEPKAAAPEKKPVKAKKIMAVKPKAAAKAVVTKKTAKVMKAPKKTKRLTRPEQVKLGKKWGQKRKDGLPRGCSICHNQDEHARAVGHYATGHLKAMRRLTRLAKERDKAKPKTKKK